MREIEEKEIQEVTEVSTALTQQRSNQDTMLGEAAAWVKSGLLPASIKTPEQAVVIALKGKELSLAPMASFEMIDVIMGKPALKPELLGL